MAQTTKQGLLDEDALASLEQEIQTAYDRFLGLIAWIPDPYSRGHMLQELDRLKHSAIKWLDYCIAASSSASGTVQSATSGRKVEQGSESISTEASA
jgi:hypothetical protein